MAAGHVAKPKRRSPEGAYAMTIILLEHWTIKLVDRTQFTLTNFSSARRRCVFICKESPVRRSIRPQEYIRGSSTVRFVGGACILTQTVVFTAGGHWCPEFTLSNTAERPRFAPMRVAGVLSARSPTCSCRSLISQSGLISKSLSPARILSYSNRESKCSCQDDFSFTLCVKIGWCKIFSPPANDLPSSQPIGSSVIAKLATV